MNLSGMGWNETLHKQGFVWVFFKKKLRENIYRRQEQWNKTGFRFKQRL